MNSSRKYVIGTGARLQWAMAAWKQAEPEIELIAIELGQDKAYQFDLSRFDMLSPIDATAFVAFDAQFLNLRRYELMGELKSRGFRMPPLIGQRAIVAASATVSENVWIGSGAIVGEECQIGFNSVIGMGANIGSGVKVGSSVWIEAGVVIGNRCVISANTTLGQGVILNENIEIGKFSVIDRPGKISHAILAKTFIHQGFDEPIVIVDSLSK